MFEPACRGGSKRSLNISNPTPKWPRSPGEMVSASARAADTHAHTRTHSHSRTPGPTDTRRASAPTTPRPRPPFPWRLGAFFFFFLIFSLPSLGFPLPQGKQTLIPAGSFRSCWVLLSGEDPTTPERREGTRGSLLCPGSSGEWSPGPAEPRSRGPGVPRGAGAGRGGPH